MQPPECAYQLGSVAEVSRTVVADIGHGTEGTTHPAGQGEVGVSTPSQQLINSLTGHSVEKGGQRKRERQG